MTKLLMATSNQVLYLHELSKQVGKYETYEELDKLTRKQARNRIWKYKQIVEGKKRK